MHVADLDLGMMGANGIVGGGGPLICGAALAAKVKKTNNVAVCFFGDGGSNQGTILESLNLASIWQLPAIFVAENNGYAESTSSRWSVATGNIADRGAAFGMPGAIVDGHDFFAVYEAAGEGVKRARSGGGPASRQARRPLHRAAVERDRREPPRADHRERPAASRPPRVARGPA